MPTVGRQLSNHAETIGGLALLAFGFLVVWKGSHYPLGSLNHLGAGAVPVGVGVVLCGFGLAIAVTSGETEGPAPQISLRIFVPVILGMLSWALIAPHFGMVPATIALVMISALAQKPVRLGTAALVALGLSAGGVLVFLQALRIPLAAIDW